MRPSGIATLDATTARGYARTLLNAATAAKSHIAEIHANISFATSFTSFAATRSFSLSSASTADPENAAELSAPKIWGAELALVERSCFGARGLVVGARVRS